MVDAARCGWLLLLAPLIAASGVLLVGVRRPRLSAALATAGLLTSFACALSLLLEALGGHIILPIELSVDWIRLPELAVQFGVLLDPLSLLMSLVVTGVGSAIFIYSIGYMRGDAGFSRYFGMLSLFAFSMLTIVLANNWLELFMGWELVGFCSYALIGHWYQKPSAADAGKKAFMVNRVADFGFMLGIASLWVLSSPGIVERTLNFRLLAMRMPELLHTVPRHTLETAALLIFCGVLGKSAQMPLHVWLPDAMEGPTSVSALIHAATMVAAGVYMLCRTFWLFAELHSVLHVIAWVGGATAFFSACLALVEADLKRILAYSTLSQLGYMVMAVGLGGPIVAMYHLTTHAFFKALLFLSAGSVIHGTHHQKIWELGGLWKTMRWTSLAFLIGSLALCGIPPLSGFWSKDEILALAHEHHHVLFILATITAGLTAFYTGRAWFVAFAGTPNPHLHPHESPPIMLVPLAALAVLSAIGGYLKLPVFLGAESAPLHWNVAITSVAVVAAGLVASRIIYGRKLVSPKQVVDGLAVPYTILTKRYFFDDLYNWYVEVVQQRWIAGACLWIERNVIIGFAVNGIAYATRAAGSALRYAQTGLVQSYVLVCLIGVAVLLAVVIR